MEVNLLVRYGNIDIAHCKIVSLLFHHCVGSFDE